MVSRPSYFYMGNPRTVLHWKWDEGITSTNIYSCETYFNSVLLQVKHFEWRKSLENICMVPFISMSSQPLVCCAAGCCDWGIHSTKQAHRTHAKSHKVFEAQQCSALHGINDIEYGVNAKTLKEGARFILFKAQRNSDMVRIYNRYKLHGTNDIYVAKLSIVKFGENIWQNLSICVCCPMSGTTSIRWEFLFYAGL